MLFLFVVVFSLGVDVFVCECIVRFFCLLILV